MSTRFGGLLYQVADKGLALELTAKGATYYKDADLNRDAAEFAARRTRGAPSPQPGPSRPIPSAR